MEIIAHILNDFDGKFGVPRQSGLALSAISRIVFEPRFRNRDALRGLDGFSHLWLLWNFHHLERDKVALNSSTEWSPTVRPPRLGGNRRMGVWATRSPFRPNNIGLSCVKIERIVPDSADGPIIEVSGADLMSGTPILDIKPYLPFTDSHPEALSGWTSDVCSPDLKVEVSDDALHSLHLTERQWLALREILAGDPRPHYQDDPERIYSFEYAHQTIRFRVEDGIAYVL